MPFSSLFLVQSEECGAASFVRTRQKKGTFRSGSTNGHLPGTREPPPAGAGRDFKFLLPHAA